jgi:hypothetical protein
LLLVVAGGFGLATGAGCRFVRDIRRRYQRVDLLAVPQQRSVDHMNGQPAIRD